MHLRATMATFGEVCGVTVVVFADDSQPDRSYVMLQGGVEETEQDRRLGLTGVHMEIDDQIRGGYDFTRRFSLDGKQLRIYVAPQAYKKLRISGDVVIDIADPNADLPKLEEALELIYRSAAE